MGQMLIRQLDDEAIARLKARAKQERTSAEALARSAIHREASERTVAEKLEIIRAMRAKYAMALVPGVAQTPLIDLLREDRDRDH